MASEICFKLSRVLSFADSGIRKKSVRIKPEWVAGINRIPWPEWIGICNKSLNWVGTPIQIFLGII